MSMSEGRTKARNNLIDALRDDSTVAVEVGRTNPDFAIVTHLLHTCFHEACEGIEGVMFTGFVSENAPAVIGRLRRCFSLHN